MARPQTRAAQAEIASHPSAARGLCVSGLVGALTLAGALGSGAHANSIEAEYPDNGARALGRAGAFAARADDPTAIYYNPAGLSRQKGFSLLASTNLVSLTHEFDAADDFVRRGDPRRLGGLSQDHPLSLGPMLAGHFDVEALPGFDFGFGVYGPSATMTKRFAAQVPVVSIDGQSGAGQLENPSIWLRPNGMLYEADMLLAYPTLSVAYQLLDQLSIGLSFQIAMMKAELSQGIGPPQEAMAKLSFADWFTPTAVLGLHYAPANWLEIGLSLRPGFEVQARGTIEMTQFENRGDNAYTATGDPLELLDAAGNPDDGMTFTYNHPMIARGGVRVVQPRFDVEVDYIFQRNSTHEYFEVDPDGVRARIPGVLDVEVPTLRDQRDYVDTHEFRLGGDFSVLPDLFVLRAGGAYATGASPENMTNMDFPAMDRWSVHGGLGLNFAELGIEVDLGYAYVGLMERTVTDSGTTIIDITKPYGQGQAIGNGTFSGHYHVGGLSVLWHIWE